MSSVAYSVVDTVTMLRRVLVHLLRNPVTTLFTTVGSPIFVMLLVYNLFGGVIRFDGAAASSMRYIDYLTPGMILIAAIYGTGTAALRVNMDMTQGIIARFKSMSVSRSSVLTGHVIGSTIGTLISIVAILGLSYLMGFRAAASAIEWLGALGLIILAVLATMWLAVAVGVASRSPEAVQSMMFPLYVLPFFSSAFVPTTAMTPVVAWIAENQPFTPIIDTLRALLMGASIGNRAFIAVAWCIGIGLVGFLWSRIAYNRATHQ